MTDVGTFYDVMGTSDAKIILDGFDPNWSDEQIAQALTEGHQGGRIQTEEERDRFYRSALMALPRCRNDAWGSGSVWPRID
jgi:hypothetical protein